MTRIQRALSRVLVVVLAALAPTATLAAPAQAAEGWAPITGTGSTWSQNALDQWRRNVEANYGMTVNYSGVGSTAGRQDFIAGTVDFAISEIPFQRQPEDGSAAEIPKAGYAYMPIVAGGTSFMYNLKIGGKRVTNLRLSGETITKIFTGVITKWNDPQIQADNPGLAMPDKSIVPVVRSDGSGTSAQFTLWMSKQYPNLWKNGMTSQYPGSFKAQKGSDGVAGYVAQSYGEGAITYVEYSYAWKAGFPVAKVLNAAGYYVEPTAQAVAVALMAAQINTNPSSPDYLTQILDGVYANPDRRAYPLSSYSYLIVPTQTAGIFTTDKGRTLGAFANYMICEGQQQAGDLGYSPLPMNLVQAGADQIRRIPGAGAVDINACNNPTFKPGDSPSNNQLALTAPQPPDCDKQGPTQCTKGTAGAKDDTPNTGGNQQNDNQQNQNNDNNQQQQQQQQNTDDVLGDTGQVAGYDEFGQAIDEFGNIIAASANSGAPAVSSPFTLPPERGGWKTWVMAAAAVLFLAVVTLPPMLSRRLRSVGRTVEPR